MEPSVSVVIPTRGRPHLDRAIASVLGQTVADDVHLVVAADLPDGELRPLPGLRPGDVVVATGGGRGGGHARNLGVEHATGRWTAFLDDDDEWLPHKLERQVAAAERILASGREPLVASRHVQIDVSSGNTSGAIPKHPYKGDATLAEYLFRNRRPGGGRASMYTSTLLVRTDTARRVPWDGSLSRHQDWDWIIRLESDAGVLVEQLDEPLARIYTGSPDSISASPDWEASLRWADLRLVWQRPGVYEDFLVAQTLRYAVAARSAAGVKAVARRLWDRRRMPSAGPIVIGAGGLLPRATIERLMTRLS